MTLFWYILKEYYRFVIGTIVLTVFLFILFDFIHRTTKYFPEYNPETAHIVQFYLYQIPAQVVQGLPIAGLLGSVVAMMLLSRTNEITAMRASGMGAVDIAMPLAVGGLSLSLFSFFLGEVVVPEFAKKMHYVQKILIEKEVQNKVASGARWIRDGKTLINFQDYDPINRELTKVKMVDIGDNFKAKKMIIANKGSFVGENGLWKLEEIRSIYYHRDGTQDRSESHISMQIKLPMEPSKLTKEYRKPNELSLFELKDLIRRGDETGADTLKLKVDFHVKLAYPFAAFVVSLIGLRFGYTSERAKDTAIGVVLAFAIGIFYWFILSSMRALGNHGDLHPFVAAWTANVVIFGISVFNAWKARMAH